MPIVAASGRFAGRQHVDWADRVCCHCSGQSIGNELHMAFERPALHPLLLQCSSCNPLLNKRIICMPAGIYRIALNFLSDLLAGKSM